MSDETDRSLPDSTSIEVLLQDIPKIGRVTRLKLQKSGFETVGDLRKASRAELLEVDKVGTVTAEKLLAHCKELSGSSSPNESDSTKNSKDSHQGLEIVCEELPTVGRVTRVNLEKAGYQTVADLRSASHQELAEVQTIGRKKAKQIVECVSALQDSEVTPLQQDEQNKKVDTTDDRGKAVLEEIKEDPVHQTILEEIEQEFDQTE